MKWKYKLKTDVKKIDANVYFNNLVVAMRQEGFERRGEIIRTVCTLRGGDRPKGAEKEFEDISVIPRGLWEPWGLY